MPIFVIVNHYFQMKMIGQAVSNRVTCTKTIEPDRYLPIPAAANMNASISIPRITMTVVANHPGNIRIWRRSNQQPEVCINRNENR